MSANSKPILDEIDTVLAGHYGFTAEDLDFILNYDTNTAWAWRMRGIRKVAYIDIQ
jgi:hypothetical protein